MSTQGVIAALYPLHIAQFLMGCVSIKLPRNNTNFKIINRKMYDYTAFAVILMMITVYVIYRQQRPEDLEETTLMKFINLLYFLIVIGFPAISVLWTNFQKSSTEKLWTDLDKVDTEIRNLGIKLNYNCIKNTSTRFLFLGICNIHLYIIYMVVSQTFVDKLQGGIAYGLQYFAALNHMSVVCSFVTLIRTISHMLEKLTRKFEMMHENSAIRRVPVLRKIMRVYHELYDLHNLVSQIFSVQVLLSFAISFVLLTLQSYNIMCGIYNDTPYFKYSVMALIFVVVITIEKFIITFCCHQCMHRSTVMRHLLGKFIAMHSDDKYLNKELNAFGLQLLHESFEIYAGNMFLIDLPIFTSVCGTATTYVILLWQTDTGVDLNYSMKKVFGVF